MKSKSEQAICSLLVLFTVLPGCKKEPDVWNVDSGYVCIKIDPNSSQAFIKAILPQLDAIHRQTTELAYQNRWYRQRLDKCLKAMEAEKGLEPISVAITGPFLPLKVDPNSIDQSILKDEPLFTPYESPVVRSIGEPNNIYLLKALLNLQILSINSAMAHSDELIENFEQRLKRLDPNQP